MAISTTSDSHGPSSACGAPMTTHALHGSTSESGVSRIQTAAPASCASTRSTKAISMASRASTTSTSSTRSPSSSSSAQSNASPSASCCPYSRRSSRPSPSPSADSTPTTARSTSTSRSPPSCRSSTSRNSPSPAPAAPTTTPCKRVFDLVKDFGTSEPPKSTRSSTTHWCPGHPGQPAFRHNIASSLRLHTGLPYDWTPRSDAPLGSPLAPSAHRGRLVATGNYPPSLHSPWRAADAQQGIFILLGSKRL